MNRKIGIIIVAIVVLFGAFILAHQLVSPSGGNWIVSAKIVKPYNPGGPRVEITLLNQHRCCVTNLSAVLELNENYMFTFDNVSLSSPLEKGQSAPATKILIGAGFDTRASYKLIIKGTSQGIKFTDTIQVQISN